MKSGVRWLRKGNGKKSVVAPLILTSLVDAFCMLLIYLIMATNSDSLIDVTPGVELPSVKSAVNLQESPTVTIAKDQYFFQNQRFDLTQLKTLLLSKKDLFAKHKAIVEADQGTPFSVIQPVMAIMSELDVESIQLAVSSQENL